MRITSKGQVTIPLAIREKLGIVPSSEVEFVEENGQVWLRTRKPGTAGARDVVQHLRGRATGKLSTEQIMRLTRGAD